MPLIESQMITNPVANQIQHASLAIKRTHRPIDAPSAQQMARPLHFSVSFRRFIS
jgi:hypothetical protein